MPTQVDERFSGLLKPTLKKKLFVALTKAVAGPEDILGYVTEHAAYMNRMESEGNIFASGPFLQEGVLVGDGLTILQTNTIEEARAIMQAEPLIERGLREFDLRPWELRVGRMTITLNASTSSFHIDSPTRAQTEG